MLLHVLLQIAIGIEGVEGEIIPGVFMYVRASAFHAQIVLIVSTS